MSPPGSPLWPLAILLRRRQSAPPAPPPPGSPLWPLLALLRRHVSIVTPPVVIPGVDVADLEAAIVAELEANAALAGLVGTNIFPSRVPEASAIPALTYELLTLAEGFNLISANGMATARIRFTSRAFDKAQAMTIVAAARSALLPVRGLWRGVSIAFVRSAGQAHDVADADDGSDDGTHQRTIDLKFKFRIFVP